MMRFRSTEGRPVTRRFVDLGGCNNAVFLAGTGRSGTTWVGDILNHSQTFRVLFEPFNPYKTPLVKDWRYREYLRPEASSEVYVESARDIFPEAEARRLCDFAGVRVSAKLQAVL